MIPVVSTLVPSTLGATLAPNIPTVTAEVVTSTTTTGKTRVAHDSTVNLSTEELIKSMEDMKLQVSKLKKVQDKYVNLEQRYVLSKINVAEKKREIKGLENLVTSFEKDLAFEKPLTEIKKILWANITQSINDI